MQSEHGFHEWACFLAGQAGKLATKGLLHAEGTPAWGHDLAALAEQVGTQIGAPWPHDAARRATRLSRFYIPTRYPTRWRAARPAPTQRPSRPEVRASVTNIAPWHSIGAGSLASTYHGEPRATQDVDIVVDPPSREALDRFVTFLSRDRFYAGDHRTALDRRERSTSSTREGSSPRSREFGCASPLPRTRSRPSSSGRNSESRSASSVISRRSSARRATRSIAHTCAHGRPNRPAPQRRAAPRLTAGGGVDPAACDHAVVVNW